MSQLNKTCLETFIGHSTDQTIHVWKLKHLHETSTSATFVK